MERSSKGRKGVGSLFKLTAGKVFMTQHFDIVNQFIGSGNPRGQFWFIGLEEAGEWSEDPAVNRESYQAYAKRYAPAEAGRIKQDAQEMRRRYTKVYDIMSKLVVAVTLPGDLTKNAWLRYRNEQLLGKSGDTFQTNLYPLGKLSLKNWPPHYERLFGFGPGDRQRYRDEVLKTRFPMLRQEWRHHKPPLTICFGKTGWPDFETLLEVQPREEVEKCRVYRSGVVFCPFFNNYLMPGRRIAALAVILRELLNTGS